eukprot:205635_1
MTEEYINAAKSPSVKHSANSNLDESFNPSLFNDSFDASGEIIRAENFVLPSQLPPPVPALQDRTGRLQNRTGRLQDVTDRLQDGTCRLQDGTGRLQDGTGRLEDGTGRLQGGTCRLQDGTGLLHGGTSRLQEKVVRFEYPCTPTDVFGSSAAKSKPQNTKHTARPPEISNHSAKVRSVDPRTQTGFVPASTLPLSSQPGIRSGNSGASGIRPGHSGASGIRSGNGGASGIRPGHSDVSGIRPGHSGVPGIRPGHSSASGIRPGNSGTSGIRPGHGGASGIPPDPQLTPGARSLTFTQEMIRCMEKCEAKAADQGQ